MKQEPKQDIEVIKQFRAKMDAFSTSILPKLLEHHGISAEQFVQVVMSEVKRDDKLLQAFRENPGSMFASVLAGAEIGLIPSEMLGEFYLIPRNLKQPDGKYKLTVCPVIGYKGLVNILMRSGEITRVHADVVYNFDQFEEIKGLEPTIIHKPGTGDKLAKNITHAYAVAKNKNGEFSFYVMSRSEIESVQKMAKVPNGLYFNDAGSPNRWMEKKAALIQLSKTLPKDYYAKKAIGMDQALEGGSLLMLDDDNRIVIKADKSVAKPARFRNIYGSINKAAEKDRAENEHLEELPPPPDDI